MRQLTLGKTGITVPQNAFGALPIQRVGVEEAIPIIRRAYEGGMRFFDTARAYSDSEVKLGLAFEGMRDKVYIASKTMAKTVEEFWAQLETTLTNLKTDYLDLYQFHCSAVCIRPGDGSGLYEAMQEAMAQGKVRHMGITCHKIDVAMECVESGLYETMQFPFSYLASQKELDLVAACKKQNMGFIAMKGLAGGLINNSKAAMAYIAQFDNVLPIWGIQSASELEEWLAFFDEMPVLDGALAAEIEADRKELMGNFCRGCGYCMPCPQEITINQCARMSLMLRRAPSAGWLTEQWQKEMAKIEDCLECGQCSSRCPYELDTPELLKKNLEDYKKVLAGEVKVQ